MRDSIHVESLKNILGAQDDYIFELENRLTKQGDVEFEVESYKAKIDSLKIAYQEKLNSLNYSNPELIKLNGDKSFEIAEEKSNIEDHNKIMTEQQIEIQRLADLTHKIKIRDKKLQIQSENIEYLGKKVVEVSREVNHLKKSRNMHYVHMVEDTKDTVNSIRSTSEKVIQGQIVKLNQVIANAINLLNSKNEAVELNQNEKQAFLAELKELKLMFERKVITDDMVSS